MKNYLVRSLWMEHKVLDKFAYVIVCRVSIHRIGRNRMENTEMHKRKLMKGSKNLPNIYVKETECIFACLCICTERSN